MKVFVSNLEDVEIPKSIEEALQQPKWKRAVKEMKSLEENGTLEIVDKPWDYKVVGCKWVSVVKYRLDGSIEMYKVRLVAKGFIPTYVIDYQETFSLVAKLNTICVLSLATNLD